MSTKEQRAEWKRLSDRWHVVPDMEDPDDSNTEHVLICTALPALLSELEAFEKELAAVKVERNNFREWYKIEMLRYVNMAAERDRFFALLKCAPEHPQNPQWTGDVRAEMEVANARKG